MVKPIEFIVCIYNRLIKKKKKNYSIKLHHCDFNSSLIETNNGLRYL